MKVRACAEKVSKPIRCGSMTNMASIKLTLHTLLMSSEVYFEMHLADCKMCIR